MFYIEAQSYDVSENNDNFAGRVCYSIINYKNLCIAN